MPLADFEAAAPASFREGAAGAHALMCRRLAHEKHARGEALAQLEQLKSRRDALAAIAAARWGFLTGLQARPQALSNPVAGVDRRCAGASWPAAGAPDTRGGFQWCWAGGRGPLELPGWAAGTPRCVRRVRGGGSH